MSVEEIGPYLEPVRKEITVARTVADAFAVFTQGFSRWWPLKTHSLSEARAKTCVIEPRVGGGVYEVRDDGERFAWGNVLVWEPPGRLVVTWHPGGEPATAQEVEVRFTASGGGTRVELEHRGWQKLGAAAAAAREGYNQGWESVFGVIFAEACRQQPAAGGER